MDRIEERRRALEHARDELKSNEWMLQVYEGLQFSKLPGAQSARDEMKARMDRLRVLIRKLELEQL